MAAMNMGNSRVGADVGVTSILEVSSRLLHEGTARIEEDVEGALVALQQSFTLECQYGISDTDGARLCRSCAGFCRGLTKANGEAPAAAVPVLLQVTRPTEHCHNA